MTSANDPYFHLKDRLVGLSDDEILALASEFIDQQAPAADQEFLRVVLHEPAVSVAEHFARQGSPTAQLVFGVALLAGEQVARDLPQALFWLRRAHVNGQLRATFVLAGQYLEAGALPYNPQKAAKYLELAAMGGLPAAQYVLAQLLIDGEGIEPDDDKAVFFLREAAKRGHKKALEILQNNGIPLHAPP